MVQERLGHSTTLDLYSHVVPGMQEAAALGFDEVLLKQLSREEMMIQVVDEVSGIESEPDLINKESVGRTQRH